MSSVIETRAGAQPVLCAVEDGIATLTLNRPERYNTLTSEVIAAISERLSALAEDSAARVVIISSTIVLLNRQSRPKVGRDPSSGAAHVAVSPRR